MHIGLVIEERVPRELLADFVNDVDAKGLDLVLESRPNSGAFMGVHWLIPTAVMLYITKSYFDGFLGEMGKDHYDALKKGLKALRDRLSLVKVTLIKSAELKAPEGQPYSMFFSIWLDTQGEGHLKFLVPQDCEQHEADRAMEAFFEFMSGYFGDTLGAEHRHLMETAKPMGRTLLLAYNPKTDRVEPFDPFSEQRPVAAFPNSPH